jgi:HK97 family phage portal protein
MLFGLFETRNVENPAVSLSSPTAVAELFGASGKSAAGITVSEAKALGVPAVWQAVNVIAGTLGHLPFHLYRDANGTIEKATTDPLYKVVHDRANSVTTKAAFWKWIVSRMLLAGRGYAHILRNKAGKCVGFLPIDEKTVTIRQTLSNGELKRVYVVGGKDHDYYDILDLPLSLKADGIAHHNPIDVHKNAIGLMIAAEEYAATLFANGGVPAIFLTGPATMSPAAKDRASEQVEQKLSANRTNRLVTTLPHGHEVKEVGFDPSKQQLIELRRFEVTEVSRIFNIAPAMLHDLTSGTYNNVEQQGLNFTQQTILPIVKIIEQELNLKIFGNRNTTSFVEINMDGLVRGDLKSRTEALARGINTAIYTPNEARALMNLPADPEGNVLLIQGATIPLSKAGDAPVQPEPEAEPKDETEPKNEDGENDDDN